MVVRDCVGPILTSARVYVFFSGAYLTSLAVTVLIIYLMNPPVTDAIQGAFFIAAFFTGIIFGGISLAFADITEGLGCMLGGFCIAMWFLTTKDGGLITSSTGRAIFIGSFCAAGYSLSFSHYTRTYGLIGCISFAGGTITMLGVDCLSRAGWKEFWLYLWNLNDDTFPLNTNTYPITRAIRVEIACVVLITLFGIISQLRLWKLIKERRDKTANQRIERERQQEQEEEELGRKIEDNFAKERAQWEAAYGDKGMNSADGTPKTSSSIKGDSIGDSKETIAQPNGAYTHAGPGYTVKVLADDEICEIDEQGNPVLVSRRASVVYNNQPTNRDSDTLPAGGINRSDSAKSSPRDLVPPPPPVVVPLPFKVPEEEETKSNDGDNSSVSAIPEPSVHESVSGNNRRSVDRRSFVKRLSGMSGSKRYSGGRMSIDHADPERSFVIPHVEDDRASSVAATLDDDVDVISLAELSPPQSPVDQKLADVPATAAASPTSVDSSATQVTGTDDQNTTLVSQSGSNESAPKPAVRQSLTVSTDPKPAELRSQVGSLSGPHNRPDKIAPALQDDISQGQKSKSSSASGAPSVASESHGSSLKGTLPDKFSKVALSYRTNEWAKHLEAAEKPELDSIAEPGSPGAQLDHGSQERPVPVSEEIINPLQSTRRTSRRISGDSTTYRNSKLIRSDSNYSRMSQQEPHHKRTPSALAAGGVARTGSLAQGRGVRRASTNHAPTYSGAPLSPTYSAGDPASGRFSPAPIPSNTLISERNALARSRIVTSPTPYAGTTNLVTAVAEHENLTLAQRRRMLQHQKPPSASQPWQQGNRVQLQGFDSHQPRRTSGTGPGEDQRREALLAGWREAIQKDASGPPAEMAMATADVEARRAAIMNETRQKEVEREMRDKEAHRRETLMGNMMRSEQMMDAHREAMRRMQAAANKKAPQ
ncbi:hypothetical protein BS50DRAFT_269596 [Corynespora cassiicola Philippines]|uniref:TM7S3/TM198-like domain-containing protein n=1 Tax=Corynespora cassiicola Philippines TaxID=1448308 RepID=A0A2T2NZW6_CORCC|nr:hypothetical protein BS50DRAFT_269596 [Corynespora cassiicola Philippines]